jgi:hypothetical protein
MRRRFFDRPMRALGMTIGLMAPCRTPPRFIVACPAHSGSYPSNVLLPAYFYVPGRPDQAAMNGRTSRGANKNETYVV